MVKKAVHILVVQLGTALIQRGGGDTGGNHKPHIHRKFLRGGQHIVDAPGVHDIGDLMGVGDDGSGAVRNDRPGKFRRAHQTGFQVNVGVNETGTDDFSRHIHFPDSVIFSQTHNQAVGDGNILGHQFPGKHIHIGGVFQHQIRLFAAHCHIDDLLLFDELAADFAGPAFLYCHTCDLLTISFYHTTKNVVYKTKNAVEFL